MSIWRKPNLRWFTLVAPELKFFEDYYEVVKVWEMASREEFHTVRGYSALLGIGTPILGWIFYSMNQFGGNVLWWVANGLASLALAMFRYFLILRNPIRQNIRMVINKGQIKICKLCGYDLQKSLPTGRCPECGWEFHVPISSQPAQEDLLLYQGNN